MAMSTGEILTSDEIAVISGAGRTGTTGSMKVIEETGKVILDDLEARTTMGTSIDFRVLLRT